MDRKKFLKSGLGGFLLASTIPVRSAAKSESSSINQAGFNHLPPVKPIYMKNMVIHKASSRGHANHGWLDTHHTFSFAQYYNPERMSFGALRVLNDDVIDGGTGFGTHGHQNMEIISIPLSGDLEHKDSMGTVQVIKQDDIQVMSAGSGIQHSEYNHNKNQKTNFLQIWVTPSKQNVSPRYDQQTIDYKSQKNTFVQILSPTADDQGVWIHQNAWFYRGIIEEGKSIKHSINDKSNGLYAFVVSGDVIINDQRLSKRDGLGVWDVEDINISSKSETDILIMEVPMNIN